jgi:RNA polymerase sigma-70 factor (ECF subfamily)
MKTKHASTDSELIGSFLDGNIKSFEILVKRYQNRVYSTAMLVVRDRYVAEDIVQDTYLKFYQVLSENRYVHDEKTSAYLVRISHNLAIDHVRRLSRNPVITTVDGKNIFEILNIGKEISFDEFDKDKEKEKLKWAISQLPEREREILMLRYFAEMKFKEISEFTNINMNTCLGLMRSAVKHLRKHLLPKEKVYDKNIYPT